MADDFTPNDWNRLESLVDRLLDAPPEERATLLAELSGGDDQRRAELERLVADCERVYPLLDRPVAERFATLFEHEPVALPEVLAERYRIVRELGRGGMAVVYLARDRRHDRDVAVKVVRPEVAATLGRARFLREISIAANLKHPHIVPLFDSGEVEGLLYYVMPYQEEQSLRERLKRSGPLAIDDAIQILRDVCDALGYAHHQGVVHRDVKPDNILLSGRHALVTDFGVARAVTVASEQDPLTTADHVVGTAAYMAPEQTSTEALVDHRADIYAVGVMAYEMLAGERPFKGDTPPSQWAAHAQKTAIDLTRLRREVPPSLAAVVRRCLSRDPEARYQSAQEVLTALNGVRSPEIASGTRLTARTWTALVAAAATVALVAIGVWQRVRDRNAPAVPAVRALAIGILPVEATPSGELDGFAKELTKQLSIELVGVPGLDMRVSQTLAAELDRGMLLDSIATLHDVDLFVAAMVSTSGRDSVTIALELIERGIRPVLGGYMHESLRLPNRGVVLAQRVADRLRPMLGTRVRELELEAAPTNLAALERRRRGDQYRLRARARLVNGDLLGAQRALDSADMLFIESQRLDTRWAAPRLTRAAMSELRAFLQLAKPGGSDLAGFRHAFRQGIAIVDSVLVQEPDNAMALALRGRLRWEPVAASGTAFSEREAVDSAQHDLEEALKIDAVLPRPAADLSRIMFHVHGRFSAAADYAERAYQLDSFLQDASTILNLIAISKFEINQDSAAAQLCAEGMRRFPSDPSHPDCALQLMAWGNSKPRPDSAWIYFTSMQRNARGFTPMGKANALATVAAVLARASQRDSARAVLKLAQVAADVVGASSAARVQFLATEAGVLFRLGDAEGGKKRILEMRQLDSVTARLLESRRSLRDVLPTLG